MLSWLLGGKTLYAVNSRKPASGSNTSSISHVLQTEKDAAAAMNISRLEWNVKDLDCRGIHISL